MVKKKRGAEKRPSDLDDELQREATTKAGEAMFPLLESYIERNPSRQIMSLSRSEVEWLAVAAICGWIKARSEQAKTYDSRAAQMILDIEM